MMGKKGGWAIFLFLAILVFYVVSIVYEEEFNLMDDDLEELEGMDDDVEGMEERAAGREAHYDVRAVSKVANVKDQDVARVVAKFQYVLLLGYAPWDTLSQELLGEFAAAAVELARQGNPTLLAKLDAVNSPAAAALYEIRGFPTLLFFTNNLPVEYSGGHSREDIVLWVRKKTGFPVTTLTSTQEADAFLLKRSTAAFGYFEKLEGPDYDAYLEAARAAADTEFVLTTVPEVAQMFMSPSFIAVRKQEPELFTVFGGSYDAKEITAFVDLNKHPLLTILNSKTANMVYSSPLKLHIMLFPTRKDREGVKSIYLEVAKQFKGKVMFLVVDPEDKGFSRPMLSVYGLDSGKPAVAGFNSENGSRYLLESELAYEEIKDFAAGLYAGTLPVYYKSQPAPIEDDGLVKMVVGKTLDKIVMDDTKDVFLFVHAPWCSSCAKVGRAFEKLAKHVREIPSLVMAKIDAQENEHPLLIDVADYPSLLLYPAGRKSSEPIKVKSQTRWKKLLGVLEQNVAIPFAVSKHGTGVPRSEDRKETEAAGGIPTEQLNEMIGIPPPEKVLARVAPESGEWAVQYTHQSLLDDRL